MKESISHVDERVLVDVRVSDPVRPAIVVKGDVVVDITLILRHCALAECSRGKSVLIRSNSENLQLPTSPPN